MQTYQRAPLPLDVAHMTRWTIIERALRFMLSCSGDHETSAKLELRDGRTERETDAAARSEREGKGEETMVHHFAAIIALLFCQHWLGNEQRRWRWAMETEGR